MPPRYSSVQRVADHLGLEFSGLQAAEAERALLAAEAWLDARTGRTWDPARRRRWPRLRHGRRRQALLPPADPGGLRGRSVEARGPYYAAVFEPLAAGEPTPCSTRTTGLLLRAPRLRRLVGCGPPTPPR
jgi:hypothetical protein